MLRVVVCCSSCVCCALRVVLCVVYGVLRAVGCCGVCYVVGVV